MTLTRRGWIVAVTAFALIALWLLSASTPDQCKVPFEQMPQWCVSLVYS